ncbi:MAG: hypothetical protein K2H64_06475 [Desulfovibrio sp.]|nr:hypothetical protein [Desulfovibrio sp.]
MSVYGINGYNDTLYKWQAQQLKNTGSSSSSSGSSSAASSLFSGTSMVSQVSSMVELTKYAMDAMGVTGNARVTFNQITKYQQQLQSEFNQGVREGFAASGISDLAGLSFSIDKNGAISAIGENASDRKKAQAWLDANPSFGQDLAKKLSAAGIEGAEFNFNISSTGKITLIDETSANLQTKLNAEGEIFASLKKGLEEAGLPSNINLKFNNDGDLVVDGESEDAEKINAWLKENSGAADDIKAVLSKNNIPASSVTIRMGADQFQVNINNADQNDIQAVLDKETDLGKKIYSALDDLGIDKNVTFSIKLNDDGSYEIISDHPDADKVRAFFKENPDLLKKFMQIETLAGIDDARKSMQISPAEMRKRIQIESMAAWWADSGDANSYFGQYSSGNMSLLAGLNLNI